MLSMRENLCYILQNLVSPTIYINFSKCFTAPLSPFSGFTLTLLWDLSEIASPHLLYRCDE